MYIIYIYIYIYVYNSYTTLIKMYTTPLYRFHYLDDSPSSHIKHNIMNASLNPLPTVPKSVAKNFLCCGN